MVTLEDAAQWEKQRNYAAPLDNWESLRVLISDRAASARGRPDADELMKTLRRLIGNLICNYDGMPKSYEKRARVALRFLVKAQGALPYVLRLPSESYSPSYAPFRAGASSEWAIPIGDYWRDSLERAEIQSLLAERRGATFDVDGFMEASVAVWRSHQAAMLWDRLIDPATGEYVVEVARARLGDGTGQEVGGALLLTTRRLLALAHTKNHCAVMERSAADLVVAECPIRETMTNLTALDRAARNLLAGGEMGAARVDVRLGDEVLQVRNVASQRPEFDGPLHEDPDDGDLLSFFRSYLVIRGTLDQGPLAIHYLSPAEEKRRAKEHGIDEDEEMPFAGQVSVAPASCLQNGALDLAAYSRWFGSEGVELNTAGWIVEGPEAMQRSIRLSASIDSERLKKAFAAQTR